LFASIITSIQKTWNAHAILFTILKLETTTHIELAPPTATNEFPYTIDNSSAGLTILSDSKPAACICHTVDTDNHSMQKNTQTCDHAV
jgi:hypothetical protein